MARAFIEYRFPFRSSDLKMVGRSDVGSDQAIINMVFQRQMFAFDQWEQSKLFNQHFIDNSHKGLKPLIIDAGANIGAASLYFSQLYPNAKFVAIEPDSENAQLARHNLAGLDAQVIEGALGKEIGTMYINDVDYSPIAYRVGETGNKAVKSHTIPSIMSEFDSGYFPLILKIDIEGGEHIVFSKDAPWLDLFPLVIIELHDWMLPFQNSSRNFFRNISSFEFDILNQGENTFCFNKRLLATPSSQ
jgi:FkbM family methyltransferase